MTDLLDVIVDIARTGMTGPGPQRYRDFLIHYDPPPIPVRSFDWAFTHRDYDGPGDRRCGHGASPEDCMRQIDEMLEDQP